MGVKRKKSSLTQSKIESTIKIVILLAPIIIFTYLIGSVASYINGCHPIYSDELYVSTEEFMDSDPALLQQYAEKFEDQKMLYHIPENLTGDGWDYYPYCDVRFINNPGSYGIVNTSTYLDVVEGGIYNVSHPLNLINQFEGHGHSIVYAGYAAVGDALQYAVYQREGNSTGIEKTRQLLLKVVKGFSLLSEVTGDGSMARYVIPDTPKARSIMPAYQFIERNDGTHLYYKKNYTGPNDKNYTFYVETGTSVDCYLGAYAGLGVIYALCNDTEIRTIVRGAVDRMLTYHLEVGWRFIDEDGKTHAMGAEALNAMPFTDTAYCMLFLRVGKTCNPEKWGPVYDKYAYNRNFLRKVGKHAQWDYYKLFSWSHVGGYFNVNLANTIAGCLCFLEDDIQLKNYYINHYLEPLRDGNRYHRNAWFDALYYLGYATINYNNYAETISIPESLKLPSLESEYIEKSVGDCLMRYSLRRFPSRRFGNPNSSTSYQDHKKWSPIENAPYPDISFISWRDRVNLNNPIIKQLAPLYHPGSYSDVPLPLDWQKTSTWIWESSPFDVKENHETGIVQSQPGDFTSPYWIGRFLNFSTMVVI